MFAYELSLDPPCNEWEEYQLPQLCQWRIAEVCQDILKRGEKSRYQAIYDIIYELVREDIEEEHLQAY